MAAGRSTYHHGDARRALLTAAAELLEAEGAAGLSLRQVAERAGLSRQAPYNHFADKEALLAELVQAGFLRLDAAMVAVDVPDAGLALERAGEAYIRCAQDAPALFRLMFSSELVRLSRHPEAQKASEGGFARLVAIVARLAPAHRVEELSLAAWCLVHGYATLCIETQLEGGERRAERARAFARIILADARSA